MKHSGAKILFIATVENHILNIHMPFINHFKDNGYTVHVATNLGARRDEFKEHDVICHQVDFSRSPYSLSVVTAFKQLLRLMRAQNFALVHVHTPVGAFLGRLAARLTKTGPVLYTVHGFHFYQGAPLINWLIYYPLERLAARWTDGMVVMNREDLQLAQSSLLRRNNTVYRAHGVGLSLDEYRISEKGARREKLREQLGCKDEDTLIITIAEFNKNKNQIQLVKALQQILKRQKNVCLLLVGAGKQELRLKKLAHKLGVGKKVMFLGYRRDIPELLHISDIFALTSLREGLPRSVMEAMAAGKPVVATDIRGHRDLIQNNVNGFLVPINNVAKTSEAILKLITQREMALEMGGKGREIIAPYAIENVLKEMAAIYNTFLPDTKNQVCGG